MPKPNGSRRVATLAIVWGILTLSGMGWLMAYSGAPSQTIRPLHHVPPNAGFESEGFRMAMFIHPFCPCTAASLRELERLLPKSDKPLETMLVFGAENLEWKANDSRLWGLAKNITSIHCKTDNEQKIRNSFHARVSGEVFLYSPHGELLFHGGITNGRGHEGANAGSESILSILNESRQNFIKTPVYGCSLIGKN